jgi:tetraacyldisaccharide 4'-kinase
VSTQELRTSIEHWLQRQWQHRGVWAWSIAPLSLLFGAILKIRSMHHHYFKRDTDFPIPVVVVGNIYIGGTGKTPVVIALVKQLRALGWHPGVISRGYGTQIGDKPLVGQGKLDANLFGDEPALIARETGAPIAVHPNRPQAYFSLLAHNPQIDLVISDDGLQHLRLHRDIEIIVQDERGTGNGWLLPAGPLREPVSRLNSVQALISRTENSRTENAASTHSTTTSSLVRKTAASFRMIQFRHLFSGQLLDPPSFIARTKGLKVMAIAGIANPSQFFLSLQNIGIALSEQRALADHFTFEASIFQALDAEYVLMTAKDAVKCENIKDQRLWVVETEICFSDSDFLPWLNAQLKAKSVQSHHD